MNGVFVVGAGVAGTAAALGAARAGARVTLADGGTGASTLSTGAVDIRPWQDATAERTPIEPSAREALDQLRGYVLPAGGAILLTASGIARPACGYDAALLDVRPLGNRRIGVVRCDRPGWDADALARAWGENYEPVEAVILRHVDERVISDADFAMRHDEEARLTWLADRLRAALARDGHDTVGLVLPPCLGVERARARQLSELVGVACGEPIASPGGAAGLRFEHARDRALSASRVERVAARITGIFRQDGLWRVVMEDGAIAESDAIVLATGGLIGGGIEYAPAESVVASALPPAARLTFRLTVEAPVELGAFGEELDAPSTLFGAEPESIAWPFVRDALMERVGILADSDGRTPSGVYVGGDLRADRPRTWLDALATGAAAGVAASKDVSERSRPPSRDAAPPTRP